MKFGGKTNIGDTMCGERDFIWHLGFVLGIAVRIRLHKRMYGHW
jgi:hypothetical protein